MLTCSAEFDDSPADRAALLRCCGELLQAGRQFCAMPRFDVGPDGPVAKPGWILSWPSAPVKQEPPRGDEEKAG